LVKNQELNLNELAFKSGSWYAVANILTRSAGIITAPIFTRLLSPADYGMASNFAAWLGILLVITGLGLPYSIGNAKVDYPSELNKYLGSIQMLGTSFSLIVIMFVMYFREQLSEIMEIQSSLIVVMIAYILVHPSVTFTQEKLKYTLKYRENIYISLFNTLGAIISCIALIYYFEDQKYIGRIVGLILPMFIMGLIFYINILNNGWVSNIRKYWSYALKISIPMIPHSLAMVVLGQIDRIMIIKYSGDTEAGLYSFGYSYAILLSVISNAVMQAYNPWLYIKYKLGDLQPIKSSIKVITLGMCILTLFIITVGPEVIKILGSKNFWNGKWIVAPIAIGVLFQYIYNSYSGLELYHKKTIIIAIGTIGTAILNFTMNYIFIPQYGYTAAAYTTLASYFALALFHQYAYKRICKKRIYDDKYTWTISIITAALGLVILQLYDFIIIRYTFFLGLLVIISLVEKKKVKIVYGFIHEKYLHKYFAQK
jgi:O-antigen/teichoic acid export membrane protein